MGRAHRSDCSPCEVVYRRYLPSDVQVPQHGSTFSPAFRMGRKPVPSVALSNNADVAQPREYKVNAMRFPSGDTLGSSIMPAAESSWREFDPSPSATRKSLKSALRMRPSGKKAASF